MLAEAAFWAVIIATVGAFIYHDHARFVALNFDCSDCRHYGPRATDAGKTMTDEAVDNG